LNDSDSFALFQKDDNGIEKIIFASKQVSLLGYTPNELKSKHLSLLIPKAMKKMANFDFVGYVEHATVQLFTNVFHSSSSGKLFLRMSIYVLCYELEDIFLTF
jgi:hypothetical protein